MASPGEPRITRHPFLVPTSVEVAAMDGFDTVEQYQEYLAGLRDELGNLSRFTDARSKRRVSEILAQLDAKPAQRARRATSERAAGASKRAS